jgi:hypothetical protein
MWIILCQTGTCRRLKHATKDYLTILTSETLKIELVDGHHSVDYHRYFLNALCQKPCEKYSGYRRVRFHRMG